MDLKTYIQQLPAGGAVSLAKSLDISTVYLSQLAAQQDGRKPSPELCVRIEAATHKQVMRWDLRSDWRQIWPELIAPYDAANDESRARA